MHTEGKHDDHWTEALWRELHEISDYEASLVSKMSPEPYRRKLLNEMNDDGANDKSCTPSTSKTSTHTRTRTRTRRSHSVSTEKKIHTGIDDGLDCDYSIASFRSDIPSKSTTRTRTRRPDKNVNDDSMQHGIDMKEITIPLNVNAIENTARAANNQTDDSSTLTAIYNVTPVKTNRTKTTSTPGRNAIKQTKPRNINSRRGGRDRYTGTAKKMLTRLGTIQASVSEEIPEDEQPLIFAPEAGEQPSEYKVLTVSCPSNSIPSESIDPPKAQLPTQRRLEPTSVMAQSKIFTKEEEENLLLQAHRKFGSTERGHDPTITATSSIVPVENTNAQNNPHPRSLNDFGCDSCSSVGACSDSHPSSSQQQQQQQRAHVPNSVSLLQHHPTISDSFPCSVCPQDDSYASNSFCTASTFTTCNECDQDSCTGGTSNTRLIDLQPGVVRFGAGGGSWNASQSASASNVSVLSEQKSSDPDPATSNASQKNMGIEHIPTIIADHESRQTDERSLGSSDNRNRTILDSRHEDRVPTELSLSFSTIKSKTPSSTSHRVSSSPRIPVPQQVAALPNRNDRSKTLPPPASPSITTSSGNSSAYEYSSFMSVDRSKRHEECMEELQKELQETKISLDHSDALLSSDERDQDGPR